MKSHFPNHDAQVKTELPVPDVIVGKRINSKGVEVDLKLSEWVVEKMQERDAMRDERLAKRMDKIIAVIEASDPKNVAITAGHLILKLKTGWRNLFFNPESNLDD